MAPLDLTDDPTVLRARGSLKWTGTRGEIAAWVAESDLGTAPMVTAALHDAVDRGLTGYLPPYERSGAARSCADWQCRRYGWDVDAERVRLVPDVVQALQLTVAHLMPPDAPVVLPTPAYMPFVDLPASWGREVVQVPMVTDDRGRAVLDLQAVDAALAEGGMVVLVNPHNPTGRVHTRDELAALAAVVEARGATVFADEIHAPLVHAGHHHVPYASVSAAAAQHSVTATAASKGWNVAGLKCAQVLLTSDEHLAAWDAVPHTAEGVSTLGAVAAMAAYDDGEAWLDELLVYLGANGRLLAEVLAAEAPEVGFRAPEGTYLAWLDLRGAAVPGDLAPGELARWLRRASGVTTVDGARCGTAGRGFVRLNLAMPASLVEEAAHRIAAALHGPSAARTTAGPAGPAPR
ncbi:aminotransferase class I/II-fold pyridoxal phosphate-dependent enzyme [Isoptericola sp. b441]|uniref:cysteine-S-conjugate beta-lyase n=1 Tax=Actinotalea lenta TaxID=3064654 RepID=A0ABT9DE50_9CELL|nr:aminotransferase class I/II-fold pyridoxal phosphate-dependent enzyme [Isoptericola sp. b441]MDO8108623.1 aminotransferase class I/II-fold pyridoxal phosphate-dependent enzyme [Isoptericola sp. b441]